MTTIAIIVAAGRGTRAGGLGLPKQYAEIGGRTVLAHTIGAVAACVAIDRLLVVIHPDDRARYEIAVKGLGDARLLPPTIGGVTRQESVLRGLEAIAPLAPSHVLIHDAARPLVDSSIIERTLSALEGARGAIAALPVVDTLKRGSDAGLVFGTIDRAGLWRAQTPQSFRYADILAAHRAAAAAGRTDFTDDAALAEWQGLSVALVMGSAGNFKITIAEDLAVAEREIVGTTGSPREDIRTGTGFDVHRFKEGTSVWLVGIEIPHAQALEGHSDADVGLHALTDAILGAIGDGDIGQHFPPSDPKWKGARSAQFLADAARRVAARGGRIVNVDLTLLCEAPRIGPHRDAMRAEVARILGIGIDRVGVKATTTEGLGFTGRREGIAAMASASVALPCR